MPTDSILDTIKNFVGVTLDDTAFDQKLILLTNSAFSQLTQLGIGPADGFEIEDNTAVWATFLAGNLKLNNVKSCLSLMVQVVFDPPQVWHLLNSTNALIAELVWRINTEREEETWVPPQPPMHPEYLWQRF